TTTVVPSPSWQKPGLPFDPSTAETGAPAMPTSTAAANATAVRGRVTVRPSLVVIESSPPLRADDPRGHTEPALLVATASRATCARRQVSGSSGGLTAARQRRTRTDFPCPSYGVPRPRNTANLTRRGSW